MAIENARLFNETKEALERQTASAEILRVISSSMADANPVFDKILESAARLTGSDFGMVMRHAEGQYSAIATTLVPDPAFEQFMRVPRPLGSDHRAGPDCGDAEAGEHTGPARL